MSEATMNTLCSENAQQNEPVQPGEMDPTTPLIKPLKVLDLSKDPTGTNNSAVVENNGEDSKVQEEDPLPASSNAQVQWKVGDECWAVWSEDGVVYRGSVVALDADGCRVRFSDYGNEEVVKLNSLSLHPQEDTRVKQKHVDECEEWKAGSPCRAVFSEDGLVYPAVVLWVKGLRCRVRFDVYNNEEEVDMDSLLRSDELHGASRADKVGSFRSTDWRRRRREENQNERGAGVERPSPVKSKVEKDKPKKGSPAEKSTNPNFPVLPPFPDHLNFGEPLTFTPPPPFAGKDPGGDATSSMMMMWYMCGYHTGSFMAQQRHKSSFSD